MGHRRLFIMVLGFVLVGGISVSSTRLPFDPYLYVYYNDLIIEGKVVSDQEIPLTEGIREKPKDSGWYFPTNLAMIEVTKTHFQQKGELYSVGDTISFKYPTSNFSYHPEKPDLVGLSSGFNAPLELDIGEEGLLGFGITSSGELRKGFYFVLDDSMKSQVHAVLAGLEADSTGTIEEIRKHYKGKKWKW